MIRNTTSFRLAGLLLVTGVLAACGGNEPQLPADQPEPSSPAAAAAANVQAEQSAPEPVQTAAGSDPQESAVFDIASVPVSDAALGEHPYFSIPEGHREDPLDTVRADFAAAAFWTGDRFEIIEGPVYATGIRRAGRDGPSFSALRVTRDLEQAIVSSGGVMVFEGEVPPVAREDAAIKRVMDPYDTESKCWAHDPVQVFVIRREDRDVWIRTCQSKRFAGFIVAETEAFVPTVSLLPADRLKQQLDVDGKVALQVNFATDSAEILSESRSQIGQVLELLRDHPELRLSVDGHTDNSGGARHNQALSERRAAAVKASLVEQGIDASRLQSRGFGQDRPVEDNATDAGRATNRRVELVRL